MKKPIVIVGAGITGCVLAERIANGLGREVLLIDRRSHIGGNCHSEIDETSGIEYHPYGPHIFHTSMSDIWSYVNSIAEFKLYHHTVMSEYKDRMYPMPVNLYTVNLFYNQNLAPYQLREFIYLTNDYKNLPETNFENVAINSFGRPLYKALIEGYTVKQWNRDPKTLPPDLIKRIEPRDNYDCRYFPDLYCGLPLRGYHHFFRKMIDHEKITLMLNTDFFVIQKSLKDYTVFYTGPIDEYFDFRFGCLEWRSLVFEKTVSQVNDFQGTAVINAAHEQIPYTRICEPKHFYPERFYQLKNTLIIKEYPQSNGEPYYPVPTEAMRTLYAMYREEARKLNDFYPCGRLGTYKYCNMDQAINDAINLYHKVMYQL